MMRRGLVVALALVVASCTATLRPPPAPDVGPAARAPAPSPAAPEPPTGRVAVAQPNPVGTWWQRELEDVGAGDLAPLWSLPLYRTDQLGRRAPALAVDARVAEADGAWSVEVDLAAGEWSDGTPVTATDVVATAEALAAARPAAWAAWTGATAVDSDTVRLAFDRPFAAWPALLSRAPGILPAHVLEEGGLEAFAEELPVTGGWFTLEERDPGVRMTFSAHGASPLGAPALAGLDVLVVPGHDTALGLLDVGDVDAVLGHVAIDPEARRTELADVVGASPFGGTRFELVWPDGGADADVRTAAATGLDPVPFIEGLLREVGRPPGGVVPALARMPRAAGAEAGGDVVLSLPGTVEGLGLLARRLQADLADTGVETSLVRLDPPQHLDPPVAIDGRLRLVRVDPARSLAAELDALGLDPEVGLEADAAGFGGVDPMARDVTAPSSAAQVVDLLAADPRLVPLAEVAVTHAWRPDRVAGIVPSAWPGIGFWNVGAWTVPTG